MEGPKHILIMFLLLIAGGISSSESYKQEIYRAYVGNRMDRWKEIIDEMEQGKIKNKEYLSQLVNFQYGYIGWCIGNDKDAQAKNYLDLAEENLELLKPYAEASLIHAYQSAFYGFKIGLSRLRAPIYGPRSVRHARLAIEENSRNPLGYIQYGNSQYYMPSVFGGSKEEAISYFQKAQQLMEGSAYNTGNDWNYLSLLTLIAQSFEETEQYDQAQIYYEKILEVEPEFSWVKNELYPQFLQKRKRAKDE